LTRLFALFLTSIAVLVGCSSQPVYTGEPARAKLTRSPDPGANYVAVVGDSFTSGSLAGGVGMHSWLALAAGELRALGTDVTARSAARGPSGYILPGQQAGLFADQVKAVVGTNDKLVILFGSRYDADVSDQFSGERLAPEVHRTLVRVQEMAPRAKILIISAVWPDSRPSKGILNFRDVLAAQAASVGATFIDPVAEQWFWGRPDLIGADGIHPTDNGHAYMAARIAPVMQQLLRETPVP
jgi:lysophospholipase L1-like esterase